MRARTCPDCKGKLIRIKLLGTGWENPLSQMVVQAELKFFTGANAERGPLSGVFLPVGGMESFLCRDCSRIFFYGVAAGEEDF
jgi:hypothetical protein